MGSRLALCKKLHFKPYEELQRPVKRQRLDAPFPSPPQSLGTPQSFGTSSQSQITWASTPTTNDEPGFEQTIADAKTLMIELRRVALKMDEESAYLGKAQQLIGGLIAEVGDGIEFGEDIASLTPAQMPMKRSIARLMNNLAEKVESSKGDVRLLEISAAYDKPHDSNKL